MKILHLFAFVFASFCICQSLAKRQLLSTVQCTHEGYSCADCAAVIYCEGEAEAWNWNVVDVCRIHEGFSCKNGACTKDPNPSCNGLKH